MGKSILSEEQWAALFAEELAGATRAELGVKYGVRTGTINSQASNRNLRKTDTGAFDHRHRSGTDWPGYMADRQYCGKSDEQWTALLEEYVKGGDPKAICQRENFALGSLYDMARKKGMRKCDRPDAVYRQPGRPKKPPAPPPPPDPADHVPQGPAITLHAHQVPPPGDWRTWLLLGGRGAGKTLAGASWLADQAMALPGGRVALIGPTLHDVREVMIEGVSGLRALPHWTRATRPRYEPSRRRLVFDNGCIAHVFSAEDPDSLRGPQFSAAWADEFCAWPAVGARGAAETLALLRMGLRLPGPAILSGPRSKGSAFSTRRGLRAQAPKLLITTTPRPTLALKRLRDEASCTWNSAPTALNAANLTPGFLEELQALYGGTRRAAQELEGLIVDLDGALFTADMILKARQGGVAWRAAGGVARPPVPPRSGAKAVSNSNHDPRFTTHVRTVVALDPAATSAGDACGIIVAASFEGADGQLAAVVLADRTRRGLTPDGWARRAVAAAEEFGAHHLVAETNQGGDMVSSVLTTAGNKREVVQVHATRGKRLRAEPVAALYEQGRIVHAEPFDALEEELMALGSAEPGGAGLSTTQSLDRADALVWAITDLLIAPQKTKGEPRLRRVG